MKKVVAIVVLVLFSTPCLASENSTSLNMTCQDYSWHDVESLVQPYLDDSLYTALIMQGQSSNYRTSEAASQAMDQSLPNVIKRILKSIIQADC